MGIGSSTMCCDLLKNSYICIETNIFSIYFLIFTIAVR